MLSDLERREIQSRADLFQEFAADNKAKQNLLDNENVLYHWYQGRSEAYLQAADSFTWLIKFLG